MNGTEHAIQRTATSKQNEKPKSPNIETIGQALDDQETEIGRSISQSI